MKLTGVSEIIIIHYVIVRLFGNYHHTKALFKYIFRGHIIHYGNGIHKPLSQIFNRGSWIC